ncbi:MAG TPA: CbiX/SirB N-terminal domain-containing protein [Limnochordia bacterium]
MSSAAAVGTLIVAHGSHTSEWPALVRRSVPLGQIPGPAALAFLEEVPEQDIPRGVAALEAAGADAIVAIPLFISSASIDVDEVRYVLGVGPAPPKAELASVPVSTRCPIHCRPALDRSPILGQILTERALALSERPAEECVVLIGHGQARPAKRRAWEANLRALSRMVQSRGGFRSVEYALLNPDTVRETVAARLEAGPVIVVPVMLAAGYFTAQVRRRLARLPCRYSGEPILPHPAILRWVLHERTLGIAALRGVPAAARDP